MTGTSPARQLLALVDSLLPALDAAGFVLAGQGDDGPMGSCHRTFARDGLTLRFLNDRGRLFVGAGEGFFGASAWARALEITEDSGATATLADEARFLIRHADAMARATAEDAAFEARLRKAAVGLL